MSLSLSASGHNSFSPPPGRVQEAMDAALQYRRKQAHASAAVAMAAGASAASNTSKRGSQEKRQLSEECALEDAKVLLNLVVSEAVTQTTRLMYLYTQSIILGDCPPSSKNTSFSANFSSCKSNLTQHTTCHRMCTVL